MGARNEFVAVADACHYGVQGIFTSGDEGDELHIGYRVLCNDDDDDPIGMGNEGRTK